MAGQGVASYDPDNAEIGQLIKDNSAMAGGVVQGGVS